MQSGPLFNGHDFDLMEDRAKFVTSENIIMISCTGQPWKPSALLKRVMMKGISLAL